MTERSAVPPHAGYDELAELDAGLLEPRRAESLRAHLTGCPECRVRADALAAVPTALRSLGEPPMPDSVRDRIMAAVAGETAGSVDRGSPISPGGAGTVIPARARRGRRWATPSRAGIAAGIIVIAAVAAVVVGHTRSSNPPAQSASSSRGSVTLNPSANPLPVSALVPTATGRSYTPASLAAAAPGLVVSARAAQSSSASGSATGPQAATGSGRALHPSAASLPASLRTLYTSRSRLRSCAAALADNSGSVPVAVDFGHWTNQQFHAAPSVFFVFRTPTGEGELFVTGPTCSGVDQVRYFRADVALP